MNEIGRLYIKLAGRDAGKTCVIVDQLEKNYVLIDGETRRRKCNIAHLEPMNKTISIKKGASHTDVKKEFEKLGLTVFESKPKKATERPKKLKQKKIVLEEKPKKAKKEEKEEKKSSEKPKEEKKEVKKSSKKSSDK
ncbi:MAG: 50S ribosomal protein L14e [Candidatus Woesearchaeota archaeon]